MLKIGDKVFMNLQEAVGWLLQNNALPFQSTANYVANTEIAKSTIINPSPAEIKVGALVLFADSKIGTVSGLTSNGFMVGSDYTDIKNALAYIVSVAINASNHLITTLSDGTTKDAGLIKEVSSMSINGSQHLIVNYNDGTTNDLGAIFSGNVNISGNLTADSIIENMSGYSYDNQTLDSRVTLKYAGAVKNGNKVTFVLAGVFTPTGDVSAGATLYLGNMKYPQAISDKLYPMLAGVNVIDIRKSSLFHNAGGAYRLNDISFYATKGWLGFSIAMIINENISAGFDYALRYEVTFLLSDSLN